MRGYVAALVCTVIVLSGMPGAVGAQTLDKKTPRKYDKLLTAVESFARLNAQIEIREREFNILLPFVQNVITYTDQLRNVCDAKCNKSVAKYSPRILKFSDALLEAHRRYQAMAPNITERNASLMSEIRRVEFLPVQLSKEKAIAALNQLDLENLYHYKAYAKTYHSADSAMLSLAASSDLTTIVQSFASTTARLIKLGYAPAGMGAVIGDLNTRVPDIRARIKALEDRRKSLVCTAVLTNDYSVDVHCTP